MRPPADYPAFGAPVFAMIDGTVVRRVDGMRDHRSRSSLLAFVYMMVEGMLRELGGARFILGNHVVGAVVQRHRLPGRGGGVVAGQLDLLLLGVVDRLGAVRRHLHRPHLARPNRASVRDGRHHRADARDAAVLRRPRRIGDLPRTHPARVAHRDRRLGRCQHRAVPAAAVPPRHPGAHRGCAAADHDLLRDLGRLRSPRHGHDRHRRRHQPEAMGAGCSSPSQPPSSQARCL